MLPGFFICLERRGLPNTKAKLVYQTLEMSNVVKRDTIAEDARPELLHALALSEGLRFHDNKGWPHGGYFTDPHNDSGIYFII